MQAYIRRSQSTLVSKTMTKKIDNEIYVYLHCVLRGRETGTGVGGWVVGLWGGYVSLEHVSVREVNRRRRTEVISM